MRALFVLMLIVGAQPEGEKQLVFTITAQDLSGGIVSELAWDGGSLVVQGVYADQVGALTAKYFVKAAPGMAIEPRLAPPAGAVGYWEMKSSRVSPTGLGRLTVVTDTRMPQIGIGDQNRRFGEAVDMGGTVSTHRVRLRDLLIHERRGPAPPYDGETWSWSPAELNRIAYVDGKGDLWIATADGRNPRRVLRGTFTLPAWSPDGSIVAVAERKKDRWEISVVHLPVDARQ